MKLISINVSPPVEIETAAATIRTGIFKKPVDGRVMLRHLNLDGDGQADLRVHGGEFKAVYVYPYEHYRTWQDELERDDFTYGQFGENFTVTGMLETAVWIGNQYRVGEAVVQVTQPRVPCFKLAIRMNDPKIVKYFLQSRRTGFYVRVLKEGLVCAGDSFELIAEDPQRMSVHEITDLLYSEYDPLEAVRALKIGGLAPELREKLASIASP